MNPKKPYLYILLCLLSLRIAYTQAYEFTTAIDLEAGAITNQGNSATCWSFATGSFLESEVIRLTGMHIDLSEMYHVRHTFDVKMWNYITRQGNLMFHGGGLAHDVMNSIRAKGMVPQHVFPGKKKNQAQHDHAQLDSLLLNMADAYIENPKNYPEGWKARAAALLDKELGKEVASFYYNGKPYTPKSFQRMLNIDPDAYVSVTSFTHQPFYTDFVLNIPHNFSHGTFYNVPIDELIEVIDTALEKGYSLVLECDGTESSFMFQEGVGMAIIPTDDKQLKKGAQHIVPEKEINQAFRQQEFENFNTTDDHLMHITGRLTDQKGNVYYKVKNSWGPNSGRSGYMYMSVPYIRLKTISVTVHKDILKQLNLTS